MKLSEQWLREWVNPSINTRELAEQLTMAGLEVESLMPVAGEFSNVVIGHVKEVTQHPDAERLRVCKVDVGQPEQLTIVCGGANVRSDLKVPVAMIGAVLGEGHKITAAKLRGIRSEGMICSTSELGLTESSEGIMELPSQAPIGQDLRTFLQLNDYSIDIHVTPNRGDCLSINGIAREIAVLNNCEIKHSAWKAIPAQIQEQFPITINDPKDCPRYFGRVIRAINSKATTPTWMVERLRRSGVRSIHPVVDVTNYVLFELGQPLHAFDLNKLKGGIEVRLATKNEKIVLLDGQEVTLDNETLVIADEQSPQALAGIMGGLASSITDTSVDVFLESAFFNPILIAGKSRRYSLSTEGNYRFERGVDPNLANKAIERATELLVEIVGGQPGPITEVSHDEYLPKIKPILLRLEKMNRVLGTAISVETVERILQQLGMQLQKQDNGWQVIPPSYRFDIALEEDLIEEVIRVYGYQHVPVTLPQAVLHMHPQSERQQSLTRIRKLFIDQGYHEAITYSFVSPKLQQLVDPDRASLSIINPISPDLSVMRTSLWPGLLTAMSYNQNRQQLRVRLFETGLRFLPQQHELKQEMQLAGIISGEIAPEQWGIPQRPIDFFDIKGDLESLFALGGQTAEFSFEPGQHPALHPGQTSAIVHQEQIVGYVGALHPALLQELNLVGPVYLFEIQLDVLTQATLPQFKSLSKFPAIRRDISFVVDQTIAVKNILELVRTTAGELLNELFLFDVYQGKGVETGFRSLAMGLLWQHPSRTLVDDEINALMDRIIAALNTTFAIKLRD